MVARIFAEQAWLGPGNFRRSVLVTFDKSGIRQVEQIPDGQAAPGNCDRVDLLLPGFINAHCHLEYTWLAGRLPRGRMPFGEWMAAIMQSRPAGEEDARNCAEAMEAGSRAQLQGGAVGVWDSTTDGKSAGCLAADGLRCVQFLEVLGLSEDRARFFWERAQRLVATERHGVLAGYNPHALYSVGQWLRNQLRQCAEDRSMAWHLAETPDEEELFQRGTGSIAELFSEMGLPMPFDTPPGTSSFGLLQVEQLAGRCDVAFHGNRLSAEEVRFFAAPRALVHCPGTHRWFDREPIPLRQWLDAGVNVCLGTDSLASCDSLSMLDMVAWTLDDHPDVTLDELLTMACVNPRRVGFLGGQWGSGRLEAGQPADMIGLAFAGKTGDGEAALRGQLQSGGGCVQKVWTGGVLRFDELRAG